MRSDRTHINNILVQLRPLRQRLIQCHLPNLCPHRRLRYLLYRVFVVFNPVTRLIRVYDAVIKDAIEV
jgi:hypothetical protein